MNELNAAIYSTLGAGTALTGLLGGTAIFHLQAPEGHTLPYVVFSKQAGGPENSHPDDARDYVYFIRAYASTAKAAGDIDAAVSALLHRKALTVTGWNNFWLAREGEYETVETTPGGVNVYTAGANYRIRIV